MSAFDGIGSARLAAESLQPEVQPPLAHFAWETDADCKAVTSALWDVQHRGDVFQETFQDMGGILDGLDPDRSAAVIVTASPQQLDFSGTTGKTGPNHREDEGIKLEALVTWFRQLQDHVGGRPVKRLVESTVPHRSGDVTSLEDRLDCKSIALDAAEFGRISRPRLWWSDVDWEHPTVTDTLGPAVKWKRFAGTWKAIAPQQPTDPFIPKNWQEPACWAANKLLPCLSPPSVSPQGTKAPRSAQGKIDTQTYHRWVQDHKAYHPWFYEERHMLRDETGTLQLLPAETKESLHHIPRDHTAILPEKKRHTRLAQSWHVGIARLILLLLLCQPWKATGLVVDDPSLQTSQDDPRGDSWINDATSWPTRTMTPGDLQVAALPPQEGLRLAPWVQDMNGFHNISESGDTRHEPEIQSHRVRWGLTHTTSSDSWGQITSMTRKPQKFKTESYLGHTPKTHPEQVSTLGVSLIDTEIHHGLHDGDCAVPAQQPLAHIAHKHQALAPQIPKPWGTVQCLYDLNLPPHEVVSTRGLCFRDLRCALMVRMPRTTMGKTPGSHLHDASVTSRPSVQKWVRLRSWTLKL